MDQIKFPVTRELQDTANRKKEDPSPQFLVPLAPIAYKPLRESILKDKLFENLWTVIETAQYLHVSHKTVYDWVYKHQIPFHKVNRLVRFKPCEIEVWLSKGGHYGD